MRSEVSLVTMCRNFVYIAAALWRIDTTTCEGMVMHIALNLDVEVQDGTLVLTDRTGQTITFSKAQRVQQKGSMITLGDLCDHADFLLDALCLGEGDGLAGTIREYERAVLDLNVQVERDMHDHPLACGGIDAPERC